MGEGEAQFVWPPAGSAVEPAPDRGAIAPQRSDQGSGARNGSPGGFAARVRSAVLDIERTWLGLESPPMAVRFEEAGWAPDPVTAYCRRCGSTVGTHEADDTGCSACRGKKLAWERMVRLGAFTGVLREMVLEVKFTRWRRLGDDLGRLLGESLLEVIEAEGLVMSRTVLVPVPISTARRLARGIDHAGVIARGVAAATGLPVIRALHRKHGPAQARLPATERKRNLAGAMSPRAGGADLAGLNVIVVDDVTTTRATLTAACRAMAEGRKALGDKGEGRTWGAVLGVTPA